MEANQLNAWEEKEKLSQALEAERQANMNNVISEMMNTVKEQKVQHMKNIKRLTNEKAQVTNGFKEAKEGNVRLKSNLDKNIQQYQVRARCTSKEPNHCTYIMFVSSALYNVRKI
jgi:hypothetical protein